MKSFRYHRATSPAKALEVLGKPDAFALGGGTDLLITMKEGLADPAELVDIRYLRGAREIVVRPDGSVRVGGAVRIADLASHDVIRQRFPALSEAARLVGTPALRNMGTIADNICQRPQCGYFRRRVPCMKNGGAGCAAIAGENQHHAILGGGPCYAVHPSDLAVVLTALEATIAVVGPHEMRRAIPISAFLANAASDPLGETVLAHGEMIEAIELPAYSAGGAQHYEKKVMQRNTWNSAFVSLAGIKRIDGEVRLVLGGVAPAPYRVNQSVEEDVASGALDDESADALAERALYDAAPLSENDDKATEAKALLRRAMLALSGA